MDPVTIAKIGSIAIPAISSLFKKKRKDPTEDYKNSSLQGLAGVANTFGQRSNQISGQMSALNPQLDRARRTAISGLQNDPYANNMYDSLYGRGVADANSAGEGATARAISSFGRSGCGVDNSRAAGITAAIQALTMGQIGNLANKLNMDRANRVNRNNLQSYNLLQGERNYADSRQSGFDSARGSILSQLAGYGQNAQLIGQQQDDQRSAQNAQLYQVLAQIAAGLFPAGGSKK